MARTQRTQRNKVARADSGLPAPQESVQSRSKAAVQPIATDLSLPTGQRLRPSRPLLGSESAGDQPGIDPGRAQIAKERPGITVRVIQGRPIGHVRVGDRLPEQQSVPAIPRPDNVLDLVQQVAHLIHHAAHVPVGLRAAQVIQRVQDAIHLAAKGRRIDRCARQRRAPGCDLGRAFVRRGLAQRDRVLNIDHGSGSGSPA